MSCAFHVLALRDLLSLGIDADRKRPWWKIRIWWLWPSSSTQVLLRWYGPYASRKYNCQSSAHSLRIYWCIQCCKLWFKEWRVREGRYCDFFVGSCGLLVSSESAISSLYFSKLVFWGHSNHCHEKDLCTVHPTFGVKSLVSFPTGVWSLHLPLSVLVISEIASWFVSGSN
jgi:hypothetical protein